jgi:hypothetical protein
MEQNVPGEAVDGLSGGVPPEELLPNKAAQAAAPARRSPLLRLATWWQGPNETRVPRRWRVGPLLYRGVLESIGLVGLVLAVLATWSEYYRPIGAFDEGVVLTNAQLLLRGELPYRDFYTNYPPGIFALLAALFTVVGQSVSVERVLGLALHLAVAGLAGRMAGRLLGQRFSLLVVGLVMTWMTILDMPTYAWLAGLALAFLACELWEVARARGRPRDYALVGATLGLLSWFRHDLFIYLSLVLGLFAGVWLALQLGKGQRRELFAAGSPLFGAPIVCAAAAVVTAILWLPIIGLAGIERVTHDLYFDQVRYTMPARVMPLPSLTTLYPFPRLPFRLPVFVLWAFQSAVLLTLAAPVLALGALLWPRGAGLKDRSSLIWPAALTIAVVPQMMGRTDLWHAVFTVAPALVVSVLWLVGGPERRWSALRAWPLVLVGAVFLYMPVRDQLERVRNLPKKRPPVGVARAGRTPIDPSYQAALDFIAKHTREDDPIYVGVFDHRWTLMSNMDLYFLADRRGATRYMQFDPGLNNRDDVQRSMIAELEQTQPKVAILVNVGRWDEPNKSREMGSGRLDRYLRSRYRQKGAFGGLRFLLRKRPVAPLPASSPAGTPASQP